MALTFASCSAARHVPRLLGRFFRISKIRSFGSEAFAQRPIDDRIPVTILTGYLGAGKTTLLNRILGGNHGLRLAVIQNEFGEVGIDHLLTAGHFQGDESIFLMNNGCLCCTVRDDLAPIVLQLYQSHTTGKKLDGIIVETTGLAVPGPILQTFIADSPAEMTRVDSVITLVDAVNAVRHFSSRMHSSSMEVTTKKDSPNEFQQQIACADMLLLNKCDLVQTERCLMSVEASIREINAIAPLVRCKWADGIPLERILGVHAFDLERISNETCWDRAVHDHRDHGHGVHDGHGHGHGHSHGEDAIMAIHDTAVKSVSIVQEGVLDAARLEQWLGSLLDKRAEDIYRLKGVLAVAVPGSDSPQRLICQSVHALFQSDTMGSFDAHDAPFSRLVFIGKGLKEDDLRAGLLQCLADASK
eukprot:TRINITY_DN7486_c0_g1_i1.p1 TRINITY_DN7486_c0_g1~~TRINITY_DN7486_c0_g1_i1.p1  ORF type:complete len:415 (+),score=49.21 TRINITY_DN7486_c0_g1_i1:114-1358(+)